MSERPANWLVFKASDLLKGLPLPARRKLAAFGGGKLVCVPDKPKSTTDATMTDARQRAYQQYDNYDRDISQQWKGLSG